MLVVLPARTTLVDGPQALKLNELSHFLEDVQIAREAYEKRIALAERYHTSEEVVGAEK
jgi:3-deoxy-7-phosphoheptulonate synthase